MRLSKQSSSADQRDHGPIVDGSSLATGVAQLRSEFVAFYDREYPCVVLFLMRCGATFQAAEDATQDAFVDAWTIAERGMWTHLDSQRGWIRTVALRKYRRPSGCRKPQLYVVPVAECPEDMRPDSDLADLTVGTQMVIEALRALSPELQAVMAFDLDGFTASEAAHFLDLTDQQVRDRRKKARKILAVKLARE